MRVLVTGGAGFIGSALVRHLVNVLPGRHAVLNIDKLTYAGNRESLRAVAGNPAYQFVQADICDRRAMDQAFASFQPDAVIHLAAESHVDRSIDGPSVFVQTNVLGTCTLLESARAYWEPLPTERRAGFRFLHVSTDEVFGSLGQTGLFSEATPYDPRSPYSASKASADHFVLAWHHTYGLPTIITNCSNNYGPFHFPEKLIPLVVLNALAQRPLPLYGRGDNVRDWLYVDDHARALALVAERGRPGQTYCIGGNNERTNLQVVQQICDLLDELRPPQAGLRAHRDLITFVADRPGHDRRYAINATKLRSELGWQPAENFDTGIRKTVAWYLENEWWWGPIRAARYAGERLGAGRG